MPLFGLELLTAQEPSEDHGTHQEHASGEVAAERVGDLAAEETLLAASKERKSDGCETVGSAHHGNRSQLGNGVSNLMEMPGAIDGCAEVDRNGVSPFLRPLPKETPAGKTENTAPELVEVDGDDRSVDILQQPHGSWLETLELTGPRDPPFRKDAHEFPSPKSFARLGERPYHLPAPLRLDEDHPPTARPRSQPSHLEVAGPRDDSYGTAHQQENQDPVQPGDMVANQECSSRLGYVMPVPDAEPIEKIGKDPNDPPQ